MFYYYSVLQVTVRGGAKRVSCEHFIHLKRRQASCSLGRLAEIYECPP